MFKNYTLTGWSSSAVVLWALQKKRLSLSSHRTQKMKLKRYTFLLHTKINKKNCIVIVTLVHCHCLKHIILETCSLYSMAWAWSQFFRAELLYLFLTVRKRRISRIATLLFDGLIFVCVSRSRSDKT